LQRVDSDFSFCVDVGPKNELVPFVGVRSDAIEHARAELMGLPQDEWTATIGGNVGYVLGRQYRSWHAGGTVEHAVDEILLGLEWFRPYMTLGRVTDAFKHDWAAANPGTPYALVVIALLNRDAGMVNTQLAHARSIFCARDDEVCDQFREFETRVRARAQSAQQ